MVSSNENLIENNARIINSNEYLEMSNHLKEILEKNEKTLLNIRKENLEMRKTISAVYGLSRTADLLFSNFSISENPLIQQIETLIHECRNLTSNFLFSKYEIEIDEDDDEVLLLMEDI